MAGHRVPPQKAFQFATELSNKSTWFDEETRCRIVGQIQWTDHHFTARTTRESRELVTLKDAGEFIAKLPKAEHSEPEWQAAMSALMIAARGGPVMLAHIGMMQALHRER
jgi:hypothetical protein